MKWVVGFQMAIAVSTVGLSSAQAASGGTCSALFATSSREERVVSALFDRLGVKVGGSGTDDMRVNAPEFYRRLLSDPELELGETYMDGLWDSNRIDSLTFKLLSYHRDNGLKSYLPLWKVPDLAGLAGTRYAYRYLRDRFTNRQTRTRSKTVALEHYDAGNELYRQMLDPTMTYTSGVWGDGFTLEDAQNAKYDLLARKLKLKPGDRVLDIGSGFGGFARFAAKNYGAKVVGITISIEQLKAARALSRDYKDVDFVFSDYRDLALRYPPGTFDHVVSIEMVEAVGPKNLDDYFSSIGSVLKDGGNFVVQGIASNYDVYNSNPWFSKYIFKDGVAPSSHQLDRAAAKSFGTPVDRHEMTADYDRTLLAWFDRFTKAWPKLSETYTPRFKRMWDFYLLSVAGGFRAKSVRLYQTVYVKGGGEPVKDPVRDLPALDRLKAMRQSSLEIEKTKALIGDLEVERSDLDRRLRESRPAPKPLAKDAKIAVIGAGPSGLSAARELKRLGYAKVVVFESASEVGGKSHTVEFDGRAHDLGATMGVRGKYRDIEKLADEAGEPTVPFPRQIDYDTGLGGARPALTFAKKIQLGIQALMYIVHHRRVSRAGPRGLEVPTPELADPWSVTLDRKGLGDLGDAMKTYLIGYGYGGPDTPAVYAHRMLDPNAIVGSAISQPIMWENGTQAIWKAAAKDLDIRYNSQVARISRSPDGAVLHFENGQASERFDKLVVAVDPAMSLKLLDATAEETKVFSLVRYMPYSTFAIRVDGLASGRSEVGYLRENMSLDRMGHPMAWIKRYADDNLFVFHLFAPSSMSDAQIVDTIAGDLRKIGGRNLKLEDSRRWPFFPHVDAAAMRESRFFERAAWLQGRNNTVFVNEALGMSTMPDAYTQGREAAARLATGEY